MWKLLLHQITLDSTNGKIRLHYFKPVTYNRNMSNRITTTINACTSEKMCSHYRENNFYRQNFVFIQVGRLVSTTESQSLNIIKYLSASGYITLFFNGSITVSASEKLFPLVGKLVSTNKNMCFHRWKDSFPLLGSKSIKCNKLFLSQREYYRFSYWNHQPFLRWEALYTSA